MLAAEAEPSFHRAGWLYEPKLDGIRCLARPGALFSRRGLAITEQYPELAFDYAEPLWLDGEIVVLDEDGRPSFHLLQQRMNLKVMQDVRVAARRWPALYYVFDVLYRGDRDLRKLPLRERREILKEVCPRGARVVDAFADGAALFEAVSAMGLEGVMAKDPESSYESGKRSLSWLKMKRHRVEHFLVCGFAPGRRELGSLALGREQDGTLVYVGQVGSGFDEATVDSLLKTLLQRICPECPFPGAVAKTSSWHRAPGEFPAGTRWLRPHLWAEVKYSSWTSAGKLRAPVFLRLLESSFGVPEDVISQLDTAPAERAVLRVGPYELQVTNLDKPIWPNHTKRDLMRYLAGISPYILPHVRDRPISLSRYPHGVTQPNFYQKHWTLERPAFVETVEIFSEGETKGYLLCNNLASLLWIAQLGSVEVHTWTARTNPEPDGGHLSLETGSGRDSVLNYPDFMVFDLDPYLYAGTEARGDEPALNEKGFYKACEVAHWLKKVLDQLRLPAYVKTSGKTGLHIYVPVKRTLDYGQIRAATHRIAVHVFEEHQKDITLDWNVAKRTGKIFLDYNQNAFGKTLASVWSPRPSLEASVSVPVSWKDLGSFYPTQKTILNAVEHAQEHGDPWADILSRKVALFE